jgi:hypothetical protein
MNGSIIKNPRKVFSSSGSDLSARITVLENADIKIIYFASISAASGTITAPTGATILLDSLQQGIDAVVSTIVNGQPSMVTPVTSGGAFITVSSFDTGGNYVLSGTPASTPIALIYVFKIKAINYSNVTVGNIVEQYDNKGKRVTVTTQSATPTINTDNTDIASITGLAQAITSFTTNLSGTPVAGQMLMIQITDNGTARAIAWGVSFQSTTGAILPTTTVISTLLRVLFQWNVVASKWDCIAVN